MYINNRKKWKSALCAALIAALLISCFALAEPDAETAPELLKPVGVKLDTAVVERRDIYNLAFYDATLAPSVEQLSFVIDGVLDEINVVNGDLVETGAVLATLDQSELQKSADSLARQLAHAQGDLEFQEREDALELQIAELELKQLLQQVEDGTADQSAADLKRSDIELKRLQQSQSRELMQLDIDDLQGRLDAVNAQLGNNQIIAPFDGRIVYQRNAQKGDSVRAYAVFFCIADETHLHIDSSYISQSVLSSANDVYAYIDGHRVDIVPQEIDWQKYITAALTGAEMRTGFDFANESDAEGLESGMYVAVFVKSNQALDALAIPANALYTDSSGRYVYLMNGDTRVRQPVSVGRSTTMWVQILDGLQEGDVVYVKE